MPIQVDSTLPHKTIDPSGKVTVDTKGAPPIKEVDSNNRLYKPLTTEEIVAKTDAATAPKTEQTEQTETKEEPKNQEAEARKLFLNAQKAERKAKEMEKQAKAGLDKAQAIEKAIALTQSGEDPTALLKAAGLDPIKFYKDMTSYALKPEQKPMDPVQKELADHKARLDEYAKNLEVQANTIREKEELASHNHKITTEVIPVLQKNPDKYEALLTEFGANAAVEVYKALWDRYQQLGHTNDDNGNPLTFERVADNMEAYWEKQIESGLIAASKLKKFANRFAQQPANTQETAVKNVQETPNRSFTLSNQQNQSVAPPQTPNKKVTGFLPGETWEERAERLKRSWQ